MVNLDFVGYDHANLSIPFLLSINSYVMDQVLIVMKGSLANAGWNSKKASELRTHHFFRDENGSFREDMFVVPKSLNLPLGNYIYISTSLPSHEPAP